MALNHVLILCNDELGIADAELHVLLPRAFFEQPEEINGKWNMIIDYLTRIKTGQISEKNFNHYIKKLCFYNMTYLSVIFKEMFTDEIHFINYSHYLEYLTELSEGQVFFK